MKHSMRLAALLLAFAQPAAAEGDGFIMGAGRWPCADVIGAVEGDNASRLGQFAGWVLGFWSAATLVRETGFVDTVESAGGQAIFEATVAECRKADPNVLLYTVAKSMIANTK